MEWMRRRAGPVFDRDNLQGPPHVLPVDGIGSHEEIEQKVWLRLGPARRCHAVRNLRSLSLEDLPQTPVTTSLHA